MESSSRDSAFFFRNGCWSVTHKTLPLYKSRWDFISRSALKGLFCLSGFSYTKSYIKLFSERIAGESSSAIVVGKSPREVTRAPRLEAFHSDTEKKPSGKCLPLLSPQSPAGFLALYSHKCIPSYKAYEVLEAMDSSLLRAWLFSIKQPVGNNVQIHPCPNIKFIVSLIY